MALPKKGLRKITVGSLRYAWSATGGDDSISLSVISLTAAGQLLTARFGYHHRVIEKSQTSDGLKGEKAKQQFVITPSAVRRVITYALAHGWDPEKKRPQLDLGHMDDKMDLIRTTKEPSHKAKGFTDH